MLTEPIAWLMFGAGIVVMFAGVEACYVSLSTRDMHTRCTRSTARDLSLACARSHLSQTQYMYHDPNPDHHNIPDHDPQVQTTTAFQTTTQVQTTTAFQTTASKCV